MAANDNKRLKDRVKLQSEKIQEMHDLQRQSFQRYVDALLMLCDMSSLVRFLFFVAARSPERRMFWAGAVFMWGWRYLKAGEKVARRGAQISVYPPPAENYLRY